MPTPRRAGGTSTASGAENMQWSPNVISPSVGRSRPAMARSVEVLPLPEAPSSTMNSPSSTCSAKLFTASTWS